MTKGNYFNNLEANTIGPLQQKSCIDSSVWWSDSDCCKRQQPSVPLRWCCKLAGQGILALLLSQHVGWAEGWWRRVETRVGRRQIKAWKEVTSAAVASPISYTTSLPLYTYVCTSKISGVGPNRSNLDIKDLLSGLSSPAGLVLSHQWGVGKEIT